LGSWGFNHDIAFQSKIGTLDCLPRRLSHCACGDGIGAIAYAAAAQYYGFSDRPFYRHCNSYYPSGMPTFRHFNFPSKRRRVAQPRSEPLPKEPFGKIQTSPIQIVISLNRQQLSLYSDGVLVTRSPISTGVRQHPTPTGVFSVIQKQLFHRSNIYSDAPMPYMQRITWSGIAIHQGVVPGHPASHGCIRLPRAFAVGCIP
jgi:hypothetical protein